MCKLFGTTDAQEISQLKKELREIKKAIGDANERIYNLACKDYIPLQDVLDIFSYLKQLT